MRDKGCSRCLKVLRIVLLGNGGKIRPDGYGCNEKREML
jgi:hypothetical protein